MQEYRKFSGEQLLGDQLSVAFQTTTNSLHLEYCGRSIDLLPGQDFPSGYEAIFPRWSKTEIMVLLHALADEGWQYPRTKKGFEQWSEDTLNKYLPDPHLIWEMGKRLRSKFYTLLKGQYRKFMWTNWEA